MCGPLLCEELAWDICRERLRMAQENRPAGRLLRQQRSDGAPMNSRYASRAGTVLGSLRRRLAAHRSTSLRSPQPTGRHAP